MFAVDSRFYSFAYVYKWEFVAAFKLTQFPANSEFFVLLSCLPCACVSSKHWLEVRGMSGVNSTVNRMNVWAVVCLLLVLLFFFFCFAWAPMRSLYINLSFMFVFLFRIFIITLKVYLCVTWFLCVECRCMYMFRWRFIQRHS